MSNLTTWSVLLPAVLCVTTWLHQISCSWVSHWPSSQICYDSSQTHVKHTTRFYYKNLGCILMCSDTADHKCKYKITLNSSFGIPKIIFICRPYTSLGRWAIVQERTPLGCHAHAFALSTTPSKILQKSRRAGTVYTGTLHTLAAHPRSPCLICFLLSRLLQAPSLVVF